MKRRKKNTPTWYKQNTRNLLKDDIIWPYKATTTNFTPPRWKLKKPSLLDIQRIPTSKASRTQKRFWKSNNKKANSNPRKFQSWVLFDHDFQISTNNKPLSSFKVFKKATNELKKWLVAITKVNNNNDNKPSVIPQVGSREGTAQTLPLPWDGREILTKMQNLLDLPHPHPKAQNFTPSRRKFKKEKRPLLDIKHKPHLTQSTKSKKGS